MIDSKALFGASLKIAIMTSSFNDKPIDVMLYGCRRNSADLAAVCQKADRDPEISNDLRCKDK